MAFIFLFYCKFLTSVLLYFSFRAVTFPRGSTGTCSKNTFPPSHTEARDRLSKPGGRSLGPSPELLKQQHRQEGERFRSPSHLCSPSPPHIHTQGSNAEGRTPVGQQDITSPPEGMQSGPGAGRSSLPSLHPAPAPRHPREHCTQESSRHWGQLCFFSWGTFRSACFSRKQVSLVIPTCFSLRVSTKNPSD